MIAAIRGSRLGGHWRRSTYRLPDRQPNLAQNWCFGTVLVVDGPVCLRLPGVGAIVSGRF
jgi:hypothetical protein